MRDQLVENVFAGCCRTQAEGGLHGVDLGDVQIDNRGARSIDGCGRRQCGRNGSVKRCASGVGCLQPLVFADLLVEVRAVAPDAVCAFRESVGQRGRCGAESTVAPFCDVGAQRVGIENALLVAANIDENVRAVQSDVDGLNLDVAPVARSPAVAAALPITPLSQFSPEKEAESVMDFSWS